MFRAAIRSLLARKIRLLLTGLSVVLGVGFMAGTFVLTDTMTRAFNDLFENTYAQIDVLVRSENAFTAQTSSLEEREPIPASVLPEVEAVPGVSRAVGDVLGYAQIVDPATGDVIGTIGPPTAASGWNDLNGFTLEPGGSPPQGPDQVVIDSGTAETYDISVGDQVEILFEGPPGEFEVVGVAGYGDGGSLFGATWALFDLPTAQSVLGKRGELDSISVVAEDGVPGIELQGRIAQALPEGAEAVTAATVTSEAQDQISTGLGFLRTAFLVFAFVALFVGAFIIFNTFAIIVAQRTRELALFRALGASGRQVTTSVMVEAVVIGIVSSIVGVLVGIGIAILLKSALNATGFEIPSSGTAILPRTFVVSILVGTLVTVVAALVPAWRAARVAPIEALREAQDRPGRSLRFRIVSGVVVLALGVIPLLYGLFGRPDNALQLILIGALLTFVGVAMLTPLIARPIAGAVGSPIRRTGVPGKLGRENSMRNPRRTAATASALMIGLGLVVFVAVFGASAKASTTVVLERTLKADFILTSPTFAGFSTSASEELRGVDGVEAVSPVRQAEAKVDGGTVFVTGIDPETFDTVSEIGVLEGSITALASPNAIAVHEDIAANEGWEMGDPVTVEWPATGEVELEVAAIYEENGLIGDWVTSLETYDANVAQELDLFVLIKAGPGADLAAVRSDVESALERYPNIEVQDQASFRDMYADFLNQLLNLVTALLLFAVIIALFGVMNTLYLSIYERTRELGLLRAVGLTRRQTRSMVRWEAVIISIMGALLGVVIGILFGVALQQALAPEGFSELGIPGGQLAFYVVFAAVLGVVFAIFPARRAAKLDVLEAISYE
ncbi:MAG TPA: FtsX-like permease family protein [Actinomycetota bacterium]|nr:FtsX-like permease family protein [Actinomycetota bacterium]